MVGVAVRMQHSPCALLLATITSYSGPLILPSKTQIHFAHSPEWQGGLCVLVGAWRIYPRGRFPFDSPTLPQ